MSLATRATVTLHDARAPLFKHSRSRRMGRSWQLRTRSASTLARVVRSSAANALYQGSTAETAANAPRSSPSVVSGAGQRKVLFLARKC